MRLAHLLLTALFAPSLLATALTGSALAQTPAYRIDTVALRDGPIPVPGRSGAILEEPLRAVITESGDVLFEGYWTAGDEFGEGLWLWSAGAVTPIAVSGTPAPGTNAETFGRYLYGFARANAAGDMTFLAEIGADPVLADEGLWAGRPGALGLVARSGDEAPASGGQVFLKLHNLDRNAETRGIFGPALNEAGQLAFRALIGNGMECTPFCDPQVLPEGLWLHSLGLTELVARTGDAAPGTTDLTFQAFPFYTLNEVGEMALVARTDDPAASLSEGLWAGPPTALAPVARTGDLAPGAGGLTFSRIFRGTAGEPLAGPGSEPFLPGPVLNDAGDLAFFAAVGTGGTLDDLGIWVRDAGSLGLLAREGDPAPGTGEELFGSMFFGEMRFNAAGQTAFLAEIDNPTSADDGIWIGRPGALSLLARTGDPVPGLPGISFWRFRFLDLNASGQAAFHTFGGGDGTWTGTPGRLWAVLRAGHGIEVGPGDLRAVADASPATGFFGDNGASRILNDSGQMVLLADFSGQWNGRYSYGFVLATPLEETAPNTAPVADAGPDQAMLESDTAILDASGSSDPEGTPFTFSWDAGENHLGDRAQTLVYGLPVGSHTITLTVTDQQGLSANDTMVLTVEPLNYPPVADAGADQTVQTLDTVVLDGSGSSDPDGPTLAYVWTRNGQQIATGANPTVGPFETGSHVITLTVTDPEGATASDSMTLAVLNRPPTANAGADRMIYTLETITLNGSLSTDPEGLPLSFVWTLDGAPIATGMLSQVGPFETGSYTITVTVTDSEGVTASDSLSVTVFNRGPVADAGPDQSARALQTITLDGSGSSDPDGTVVSYVWSLDGIQIGTGQTPSVGPFAAGLHTLVLTVTDSAGASGSDTMLLTVLNDPPVANAGPDQSVMTLDSIVLDGALSFDPEGGDLSYAWSLGGALIATGPTPSVGPFDDGVHTITLTVTDSEGATASDSVAITVQNRPPVADAGPDFTAPIVKGKDTLVTLDGSASLDPDGAIASYVWRLDGAVIGEESTTSLSLSKGVYTFTLTVTDDDGTSAADSVVVTVTKGGKTSTASTN